MRQLISISLRTAYAVLLVFVVLSFVPSNEAYYRIERILTYANPLGSASQHVRSIPATASSLFYEIIQNRSLEVEGVNVNFKYAVNPSAEVQERKFESRVLNQERFYSIYLPPGYEDSDESYPSLYLLHGMGQADTWWTEVARIDLIATAMIESGKIEPLIIVMPNGNRNQRDVSTTSLYDNRCETGLDVVARALKAVGDRFSGLQIYRISCETDFEDYIVGDLLREIESNFRANEERFLGGFSIGGRGAMQLALKYQDVFNGAFGLSGNYDFLRKELRQGNISPLNGTKLFLASGNKDQRGIYGELNTFLFHKELGRQGFDHLYCIYEGTHSDMAWVAAMPQALQFMMPGIAAGNVNDDQEQVCKS